jgi:hypothetical protein
MENSTNNAESLLGVNRRKNGPLLLLLMVSSFIYGQNYTSPFTPQLTLLPDSIYNLIAGESSGEQAYYHILELAPYEKNRTDEDYRGDLHETRYVLDRFKEYGFKQAAVERLGKTKTWDGISASLWEVSPRHTKIADYRDLSAILVQGSATVDTTAQLVWIGRGTEAEINAVPVKGKILVTEAAGAQIQEEAIRLGAVGIISYNSPRPLVDPVQIPNTRIKPNTPVFCINLPPREGYELRDRLLGGDTLVARAITKTQEVETDIQVPVFFIEGTDENAEEVILSAHLFEGYVKLGANDNTSGAAAILEAGRVLNTLIETGAIPRPRRTIRFLWMPEFEGSIPWANSHKDITGKTLCDINLDMVGLWLSRSNSFFCLHRTTFGNPHYVNDVLESIFHYVGATNKGFTATGAGRPEPLKPIFSLTGSRDPFYYSVGAHQGSSDHEVFNDFGVQVPGVMLVSWPDNYYHTSGDRAEICDPTQLRRAVVIAAVAAYSIASAGEDGALKIASEVSSNAVKRIALTEQANARRINAAITASSLEEAFKRAVFDIEASADNEIATLQSVSELANGSPVLGNYLKEQLNGIKKVKEQSIKNIENTAKAHAALLKSTIKPVSLTKEEQQASKIVPKATPLARESGYGVIRNILSADGQSGRNPFRGNFNEIARLTIGGSRSILDIKKALDAQFPNAESLEEITRFIELLKAAKLVEYE